MLDIDYNNARLYNSKCTGVLGYEHGASMTFNLTQKAISAIATALNLYGDTLNVYADGYINLTSLRYNDRREEWEEKEVSSFGTKRTIIEDAVNVMLTDHPLDEYNYISNLADLITYLSSK